MTKKRTAKADLGLTREGKPRKDVNGRKPKIVESEETLNQFQGLGRIQATIKEMASFFKVSEPTIHSFLKSSKKAQEAIEIGYGEGKVSLRRLQFKQSERSTTMSIWLGKQYLGQADKMEENVTAKHQHTGTVTHQVEPNEIAKTENPVDALKAFDDFRSQHAAGHA